MAATGQTVSDVQPWTSDIQGKHTQTRRFVSSYQATRITSSNLDTS
ncbi:hypothetical protein A2U01_0114119, partial [Trifolium medium]|nr:hypothetical protein [Trifolium medium]